MDRSAADAAAALAPSGGAARPATLAIVAAFAAVYLIWGSTYLAIRVAVESLPPLLMAGARFVTAGVLMYAFLRWRGAARPTATHWRSATVVGALLLLGGNGLVVWAAQFVPSGVTALLVATVPLWMVVLNAVWPGGSRPRWREIAGLFIGFVGLIALVWPGLAALSDPSDSYFQRIDLAGAAALVLASLSWAIGSLHSRRAALPADPLLSTAMQMICGGALQALVGLTLGELGRFDLAAVSWRSGVAWVYLMVFGSWVAFSAYVWLLRVVSPAKAATYAYVNPAVAVLLGWLVLGEPLSVLTLAAMGLIVAAVVLITTTPRPAR